jgi:hypothetical protein
MYEKGQIGLVWFRQIEGYVLSYKQTTSLEKKEILVQSVQKGRRNESRIDS